MALKTYSYYDADAQGSTELLEGARKHVIRIMATPAQVKILANRVNVQRHRSGGKFESVHLKKVLEGEETYLELFSTEEQVKRRKQRETTRDKERYDQSWPRRAKELQLYASNRAKPEEAKDFIMWVGSNYYPTIEDFVTEGKALGISKRINNIPDGFVIGQSRIFLAHRDGARGKGEREAGERTGTLFGFFMPERIDLIIQNQNSVAQMKKALNEAQITLVSAASVKTEAQRGCGYRRVGGLYFVSTIEENAWARLCLVAEQMARKVDVQGGIAVFAKPIEYFETFHRGVSEFDPKAYGIKGKKVKPETVVQATKRAHIKLDPQPEPEQKPKTRKQREKAQTVIEVDAEKLQPFIESMASPAPATPPVLEVDYVIGEASPPWSEETAEVEPEPKPRTRRASGKAAPDIAMKRATESKGIREPGKCFDCGEDFSPSHHHTTLHEDGRKAYVVTLCCACVGHEDAA